MSNEPRSRLDAQLTAVAAELEAASLAAQALEAALRPVCGGDDVGDLMDDLHEAHARVHRRLLAAAASVGEAEIRVASSPPPLDRGSASAALSSTWTHGGARGNAGACGRQAPGSKPIHALRVLVVEDEHMIAADIAAFLAEAGHAVIGPVATLDDALLAVEMNLASIDAAVLDINLSGEPVWPVAETLRRNGVPILFATAYSRSIEPPRALRAAPRLAKPIALPQLLSALAGLR